MKWSTGVHQVQIAAAACADMAEVSARLDWLRVTELWAVGAILGRPKELEWVTVALSVDLPPDQVPWWSIPQGADGWSDMTRLSKYPLLKWWRSAHAPVWNHRIVRPVLVWSETGGLQQSALDALREGRGASVGLPEPSAEQLTRRLDVEIAISLAALRARNQEYEDRRWGRGKLERIADPLWHATDGYLDQLAAGTARDAGAEHRLRPIDGSA
jgi:hypothetical protein